MSDIRYLSIPTVVFLLSAGVISVFSIDIVVSDFLYLLEGGTWALRDNWVTENLIHTGGRELSVLLAILLLITIMLSGFSDVLRRYRRGLIYLFVSALAATVIVSLLKSVTHRDCPWDLLRYGGEKLQLSFFSLLLDTGNAGGKCFPAGHASAGYCWFGLYFFASRYFPDWRRPALMLPIVIGLIFGIDQQLRGAHFLSHDLWSAWISWTSAFAFSFIIKKDEAPLTEPLNARCS